jgi:hypothetical protein
MMTIVTHVRLKEGAGRDWDAGMRTRLLASKKRPGWVGGQLLRPADKPDRRLIVGTWIWNFGVVRIAGDGLLTVDIRDAENTVPQDERGRPGAVTLTPTR